jgi:hypothetical protein
MYICMIKEYTYLKFQYMYIYLCMYVWYVCMKEVRFLSLLWGWEAYYMELCNRVTRLDKFLPNRRWFSSDICLKMTEVPFIFWLLFQRLRLCINFDKKMFLATLWAIFYKLIRSPCSAHEQTLFLMLHTPFFCMRTHPPPQPLQSERQSYRESDTLNVHEAAAEVPVIEI